MNIEIIAEGILKDNNFGRLKVIIARLIKCVYLTNTKNIFSKKDVTPEVKKDLEEARIEMKTLGIEEMFFASDEELYDYIWKINNKIVNLSR